MNFSAATVTPFLYTLTFIIIVSFAMWGGWRKSGGDFGQKAKVTDTAMTVFGKDYTIADVQRAQRSVQFAQYYLQSYELPSMLMMLSPDRGMSGGGMDTFANLFIARHLMEELGIRPSDEEARAAMEKLPACRTTASLTSPAARCWSKTPHPWVSMARPF